MRSTATAPLSRQADIEAAFDDSARAFESWRDTTPSERQRALLRIADAIEERADELVEIESRQHRQAEGPHRGLRRCRRCAIRSASSPARRVWLEGRSAGEYMAGVHLVHPARARRRVRSGWTPWNYPAMMAVWKWAPARGRGQHDGAQAVRHDARELPRWMADLMAEFLPPGVFNVVCGDRETGAGARQPPDTADGVDHRGSVGAGIAVAKRGGRRRQADPPGTRRQGAGDRFRRRRHRLGGGGDRDRGLLQRRPGLHGGHARARRSARPQRLRRSAGAAGARPSAPGRPTTARSSTARCNALQLEPGLRVRRAHAGPRNGWSAGGLRQGDRGYFFEPTVVEGSGRTMR